MGGKGTLLAGAVVIAGAFGFLKWWEARGNPPPPPPEPAPGLSAASLSRPDALPGAPRGEEETAAPPADSLGMVRRSDEYSGVARPGPMANSRPEPPLSYEGAEGPARPGSRVIRSKREWDALWRELGGHDMPVVDWTRYMGLAVFAGERPAGTKVAVVSAKEEGGRFTLRWRSLAGAGPGTTRPYKVVLAPRRAGTPVFREERQRPSGTL